MVIVLTIKELSYLVVGLFDDLGGSASVFIFVTLSSLAAPFALIRPYHE